MLMPHSRSPKNLRGFSERRDAACSMGVFVSTAALCDLYWQRMATIQERWTTDQSSSIGKEYIASKPTLPPAGKSVLKCESFRLILSHVPLPECRWEANSAGVSGGFKGRPFYCSGTVTLWWTCVGMQGEWSINELHTSMFEWFSISGCVPAPRL